MSWLSYIPLIGSAVSGIVDMIGGGPSSATSKPQRQRQAPQIMAPQVTPSATPPVQPLQAPQAAAPAPNYQTMAAQRVLDRMRAQRMMMAGNPTNPSGPV